MSSVALTSLHTDSLFIHTFTDHKIRDMLQLETLNSQQQT